MALWLKAFHLIAMVCWFAGLFYLPRLFVYHANIALNDSASYERYCQMERRLYWGIMTPSAIATLILGMGLLHTRHYSFVALPLWLKIKLGTIALLVIYHLYCGRMVKHFQNKTNSHSALFYRWLNEAPIIALVITILAAVFRV